MSEFCKHRTMDKCRKHSKICFPSIECFEPEEQKTYTNADRIRAMSNEKLAEFLAKSDIDGEVCIETYEDCFTYKVEKICPISYSEIEQSSKGIDLVLRWLSKPAEEGQNER